jgi:endonuclease/exonuclease/phosphatase family metal-dependent hydrolase
MLLNHAWKWFMGLLLAGLLPCPASPSPAPVDDSILVVSWNIEWFPGRLPKANPADARQHMVAAKTALGELAPDVLLLQEIADWDAALELVSDIPGMQVHVVSEFHERPQNLVIASKLPVDAAWYELWKDAAPATPPRGFAFAALRLPDGRFLLCYTVHYKSNHGDAEANFGMRQQASRQLLEHAVSMLEIYSRRGECVLLIGGDFNSSVDDPQFINDQSVRALQFAGLSWIHAGVPFEKRVTWPARGDFADTCFDHIFAAPAELISVQVPHLPEISDHNPIVARYRFPAGPSPTLSLGHLDSIAPTPMSREQIPEASTGGIAGRAESRDVSGNAISADNTDALKRLEGRNVRVQGVVRRVGESPSGHMVFINFGTRRGDFTAIVRRNHVRSVSAIQAGKDLGESLPGRRLEVRGRIELYKGSPQIEVTKPGQLRFL